MATLDRCPTKVQARYKGAPVAMHWGVLSTPQNPLGGAQKNAEKKEKMSKIAIFFQKWPKIAIFPPKRPKIAIFPQKWPKIAIFPQNGQNFPENHATSRYKKFSAHPRFGSQRRPCYSITLLDPLRIIAHPILASILLSSVHFASKYVNLGTRPNSLRGLDRCARNKVFL